MTPRRYLALADLDLYLQADTIAERHRHTILAALTREESVFTEADVTGLLERVALNPGEAPLSPAIAAAVAARIIADEGTVLRLASPEPGGAFRYATPAMVELEARLMEDARALQATPGAPLSRQSPDEIVAAYHADLVRRGFSDTADEHPPALAELLGPGELKILDGPPGAGKSALLKALVDAFNAGPRAGGGVIVAAPSPKISAELAADTGAPGLALSDLLDRFRSGDPPVGRGGLIVLDEAGMVGSRQMAELVDRARDLGVRLVLTGDAKQIPPAEAGQPFRVLAETLPTTRLTRIVRQTDAQDRADAMALRAGETGAALESFARRGKLSFVEDPIEAAVNAYVDWRAARGAGADPRPGLVLTVEPEEAAQANDLIRKRLVAEGLVESGIEIETATGRASFGAGDRVMLQRGLVVAGAGGAPETLHRGTTGTVEATTPGGDALVLRPDGKGRAPVLLPTDGRPALAHAAALDLRMAQGVSEEQVFPAITRPVGSGELLVAMTRHKVGVTAAASSVAFPRGVADLAAAVAAAPPKLSTLDLVRPGRAPKPQGKPGGP